MDDFRIRVGFLRHPKTRLLRRKLGGDAVLSFLQLIEFCTLPGSRYDGDLAGMSDDAIAVAADWPGDTAPFVDELASVGFLDGPELERSIHDFAEHNPYVAGSGDRSEAARIASLTRWHKKGRHSVPKPDCPLCPKDAKKRQSSGAHRSAMRGASRSHSPRSVSVSVSVSDPDTPRIADRSPPGTERPKPKRAPSGAATPEDLAVVVADLGWAICLTPKQVVAAQGLCPISPPELQSAIAQTTNADGKPNAGLLLSIVQRQREAVKKAIKPGSEAAAAREREGKQRESERAAGQGRKKPIEEPVPEERVDLDAVKKRLGINSLTDLVGGVEEESPEIDW